MDGGRRGGDAEGYRKGNLIGDKANRGPRQVPKGKLMTDCVGNLH